MRKVLQIIVVLLTNLILVSCSSDIGQNPADVDQVLRKDPIVAPHRKPEQLAGSGEKTVTVSVPNKNELENEKTVVVSVNNYGRSNPFKPFQERSMVVGTEMSPYNLPELKNIPPPPMMSVPNQQVTQLLETKVNGILYDPERASAINNINKNDYLVHKGDKIFGYYIKDISADKVTIKYENNIYRAGIGEYIGGKVNIEPVQRANQSFGGAQNLSSLPEINIVAQGYSSHYR